MIRPNTAAPSAAVVIEHPKLLDAQTGAYDSDGVRWWQRLGEARGGEAELVRYRQSRVADCRRDPTRAIGPDGVAFEIHLDHLVTIGPLNLSSVATAGAPLDREPGS